MKNFLLVLFFGTIQISLFAQSLNIGDLAYTEQFYVRESGNTNSARTSESDFHFFTFQNSENSDHYNKYAHFSVNLTGIKIGLANNSAFSRFISINESIALMGANVGIGTTTPKSQLSLGGGNERIKLAIYDNGTGSDRYGFGARDGIFGFYVGSEGGRFTFFDKDSDNANAIVTIWPNEGITIGTLCRPDDSYKLVVNSGILSKKVRVEISGTNWCDYVFEDTYDLRTLKDLEDFIISEKHLPEIPTTEDVDKNGIDLGQMDALLLKKIEELTLYIIELNKEIEKLKAKENE